MATLDPDTTRRIESFVTDWLTETNTPGTSVAIVAGDEVVYTGGFGSRQLVPNEPATPTTRYGVASCTKSVTALAILLLADRGELAVEDPISEYLPAVTLEGESPIRIHDLLIHASGIPSLGSSTVLLSRLTEQAEHGVPLGDREDFYRHLNGAQSEVGPRGERCQYFNGGYNLLGEIVESVTGASFAAFVTEEILTPLGMSDSTFDPEAASELMTPYTLADEEPAPTPFPHRELSYPAGGLIAPVTDLTRYLRFHRDGHLEGTALLATERLREAHQGHMQRAGSAYGYGWGRHEVAGETVVSHGGSLGVSSSFIGFQPDGEYAVAMGANTTPSPTPPTVAEGIFAILAGEAPADAVPYYARTQRFDALTGAYESYRGIKTATVEQTAGVLGLTIHRVRGDSEYVLVPTAPEDPGLTFEVPSMSGHRRTAEFVATDDGYDLLYARDRFHQQS